ncbi:PLP-dependent lyase/thiolase [Micromonospora sp. WMMA1949]|uniref:threonine ammonia-lyase n=1 Tax=unclassified Micromonospora TaxID=2617518 RepID=UPI0022B5E8C4|nr:PLP-dependent lyase/thiolase [Micromonospora sp. WMMA1949]MCZ7428578.1 PLP-dependent lyase/thiolase [Micromonospora sp. WMMA1949]
MSDLDLELNLDRVAEATRMVDPVFRDSPQFVDDRLCAAIGREVLVKVETVNPVGSFKGRGASYLAHRVARRHDRAAPTLVCATSGNFGVAVAYAGRAHGLGVHVFVPPDVNPAKRARMVACGAEVRAVTACDTDSVERTLRDHVGAEPGRMLVTGGEPEIAEGAATIGAELLTRAGNLDAVVLPVGGGALVTGVALWFAAHSPRTRIIGACAAGSPAVAASWRAGHPVSGAVETIAEGIAVDRPHPAAVRRLRAFVHDMVLVDDAAILRATSLIAGTLGLLVEPTGAVGLAAVAAGAGPGRRVATVLTGGAPRPELLPALLGLG